MRGNEFILRFNHVILSPPALLFVDQKIKLPPKIPTLSYIGIVKINIIDIFLMCALAEEVFFYCKVSSIASTVHSTESNAHYPAHVNKLKVEERMSSLLQ